MLENALEDEQLERHRDRREHQERERAHEEAERERIREEERLRREEELEAEAERERREDARRARRQRQREPQMALDRQEPPRPFTRFPVGQVFKGPRDTRPSIAIIGGDSTQRQEVVAEALVCRTLCIIGKQRR